jgi:hypothetical protein
VTGRELNKSSEAIRAMIDHRLKSISVSATMALPPESHLDEDTISAFVEGRLNTNEAKPVLSHLTACSACRGASAQLVRLDEIAPEPTPISEETPDRISNFLSNLFPAGEDVVFAYQNPNEEAREKPEVPDHGESEEEKEKS